MTTATCIYCCETKPLATFNREHVLPEAFGKYERNLVLHDRVCKLCNDFFSKHLDGPLARDTKEGLERFKQGLVREKKKRTLGKRLAMNVRGGRLDGAILEPKLSEDGTQFAPTVARQLGFGWDESGPFTWYSLDRLPSRETLAQARYTCVATGNLESSEAAAILADLGFSPYEFSEIPDQKGPDGMVDMTTRGRIDTIILRAVAKLAFNYFIHHCPAIARMGQFDPIRRFIRFGKPLGENAVDLRQGQPLAQAPLEHQVLAHVLTVRWDGKCQRVIGQVSLFGWVQYEVSLSSGPFAISPTCVASGHVFNPFTLEIAQLTRDPNRARPLPLVPREDVLTKPRSGD